ncbi:hypothetical protein VKT23_007496 [Stygiomarasmius scandens]|uniref:Cytochrome P450 n=1 Tax=Marasmiellus scandens TaxID=2682957 RepID=A0ABR1JQI2_9AGAR
MALSMVQILKAFSSGIIARTLALTILTWLLYVFIRRSRARLPPGPRGIPFIGNVLQMDNSRPWRTFTKWKQLYGVPSSHLFRSAIEVVLHSGPLVYVNMAGQPFIILNSKKVVEDLLVHRAQKWRKMRRASETVLGPKVATNYYSKQTDESVLLAYDILKDPDAWKYHFHRTASSSILSVVYDLPSIQSPEDPIFAFMDELVSGGSEALLPGSHLVETFPILDCLPDSLAKWRTRARAKFQRWSAALEEMFLRIKNKSTTGVLHWFLFVMILFPDVQRRAQEELDAVVGQSRLPSFADMKQLPYIQAIVKEILRWKPPAPSGVPHALAEDDYYEGYLIPKGTIVSVNLWSINCDPDIHGPDAGQFRPERFLDENGNLKDPRDDGHFSYGFGYRVCVGRHVANNFMFIAFATILWAMQINPVKDSKGQSILPDPGNDTPITGVTMHPPAFEFAVSPRFEDVDMLIQQARDEIVRANEARSSIE